MLREGGFAGIVPRPVNIYQTLTPPSWGVKRLKLNFQGGERNATMELILGFAIVAFIAVVVVDVVQQRRQRASRARYFTDQQ